MRLPAPAPARPGSRVLLAAALLAGLLAAPRGRAANPTFVVRYRSAANVYLDGGQGPGPVRRRPAGGVVAGRRRWRSWRSSSSPRGPLPAGCSCEKRSVRAGDTATLLPRAEAPQAGLRGHGETPVPTAVVAAPGTGDEPPGQQAGGALGPSAGYDLRGPLQGVGRGGRLRLRAAHRPGGLQPLRDRRPTPEPQHAVPQPARPARPCSLGSTRLDKQERPLRAVAPLRAALGQRRLRGGTPGQLALHVRSATSTAACSGSGWARPCRSAGSSGGARTSTAWGPRPPGQKYGGFFRVSRRATPTRRPTTSSWPWSGSSRAGRHQPGVPGRREPLRLGASSASSSGPRST